MKRSVTSLVTAVAGCIALASHSPADQVDVFVSGEGDYHTYRIPAVVLSNQGTLLAFCEGRKTSRSDHGDIDLLLRRSTDGGKTFGPVQLVHEEGGTERITCGNPTAVADQDTGTVWLAFCRNNDRVLLTHSDDDGKTWAKPDDLTNTLKESWWTWYATGPGQAVQLRRGEHQGPADRALQSHRCGQEALLVACVL